MADDQGCPHKSGCELYPRFSLKGALRIWQDRYCNHGVQHLKCERYLRAKAGQPVPATLLPNGDAIPT